MAEKYLAKNCFRQEKSGYEHSYSLQSDEYKHMCFDSVTAKYYSCPRTKESEREWFEWLIETILKQ